METSAVSKQEILSKYMEYVLEHGENPKSIYAFAKALTIEEKNIYEHYTSFEDIANSVYETFYEETHKMISGDEIFIQSDAKNKLLLFYYTFFELLTANRSYVLLTLKENKNIIEKIQTLKGLRVKFREFIKSLPIETLDLKQDKLNQWNQKSLEEMAWKQLLFTIQFWLEDTSTSFEKTDIFIEKSVNASFDLLDITPIKNLIDFGKFFFKEKIKPTL
ncbi:TetR/AcrR family transcriptional regulator [Wenyingzhuangia sp. 2_MG-2023]|uniref:TetR/AcrR family transcriptional regulator n=1 Tax=Wenyingzhuangia sp. 2_MG-2023 TaxID=3062639 RepID=UPI0026E2D656|nr:TetR/AcrR family transcriptional regulator [Wenyingzhuangia sp. 2_MG-2023]MDO6737195.1 TetR/AcrR family transcriptional regulator [Wenyingzhuangia sp. 2_MG-2023]MDO6801727.1 TetR/AcrR family transcriptional regulator [Wenyingzhuangia sp. 1_MG-2023]